MLKKLQKYFSAQAEPAATAAPTEEVNMSVITEQAAAPAENEAELQAQGVVISGTINDPTAELSAQLETVTAALTDLQGQLAELTAKYETAQAALNAAEAAKAELAAQAVAKEMAERKEAIVKAVGTDKAEAVLAALTDVPREQFNTIVSAMAASVDAEAQTEMFTEQGAAAEASVTEKAPTHFNQFIKK